MLIFQHFLARRRVSGRRNAQRNSHLLMRAAKILTYRVNEMRLHFNSVCEIQVNGWGRLLNGLKDLEWQQNFQINKSELAVVVRVVGWPVYRRSVSRKNCSVFPTLATPIFLRRLASPCRQSDIVYVFFKLPSQMSNIFQETLGRLWKKHRRLVTGTILSASVRRHTDRYASAVYDQCKVLDIFIDFITGSMLVIVRLTDNEEKYAAYNGHKRNHALKFQITTLPNGLILYAHGPMADSRHDWALSVESHMDARLEGICDVDGRQFCIHGDSGCNSRPYLDTPFLGCSHNSHVCGQQEDRQGEVNCSVTQQVNQAVLDYHEFLQEDANVEVSGCSYVSVGYQRISLQWV